MSDCGICNKPKISPDLRCDCRLEWQTKKSFYQNEKIQSLTTQRDQLNEKLKEVCEKYSSTNIWSADGHQQELARQIEQQRKEIMGE